MENLDSSQADYTESDSEGFRVAVRWDATDNLAMDYSYDQSEVEAAQLYYQVDQSTIPPAFGGLPPEPGRDEVTRFPVSPFEPNNSEASGHTLNIAWFLNDLVELRSITGQREVENEVFANYAGALAFGGLVTQAGNDQDQLSQELQLVGGSANGSLEFVTGLYYFEEEVNDSVLTSGSLIVPGILIPYGPPQIVNAEAESYAAFGQVTWTPGVLEERLRLTFGLRYTEDKKQGVRDIGGDIDTFDSETDNTDPTITVDYEWTDDVSTYLRWANGYRAGGANLRSARFRPYEEETLENWELGLKSELFDRRVRLNAALFKSYYDDRQMDFSDPYDITVSETINANEQIDVEGLELDLTAVLTEDLLLGVQWVYMDYDVPPIFNPLSDMWERFELPQVPESSGSVSLDYSFDPFSFGTLSANLTWNYSDSYWFSAQNFKRDSDGYELLNARISLQEIPLGSGGHGKLRISVWGKNLTDDEWFIGGIESNLAPGLYQSARAYGDPRTYGVDLQYTY